jgi:hypothetical protein
MNNPHGPKTTLTIPFPLPIQKKTTMKWAVKTDATKSPVRR